MSLKVYLFGAPRLAQGEQSLHIGRRKVLALMAYLVQTRQPHSREALAALLWPEYDQSSALQNLRRDLARLRQDLSGDIVTADRLTIGVDPQADIWVDVCRFEDLLGLIQAHNHFPARPCPACIEAITEAADLYSGDFMAGFNLPDCPAFDEWQFFERQRLRQLLAEALQKLIRWHAGQAQYEAAIDYGRRWLALDNLHEAAHRRLMELYARAGQQAAALRQYEECLRLLDEELGVEPEAETTELYEAIRSRRFPAATPPAGVTPPAQDRYLMERPLALGGQGELYLGLDQVGGEQVTIKRLRHELLADPERVARFVQEGEALRQLNHPNIVRMLASFEREGLHYIVTEYVPGGSLRQLLERRSQLPLERALDVALELADALTRAHHLGIIHRDLKPENVLLAADGTPRLTDFGIARLEQATARLTHAGALLGSPPYMSPEALRGEEMDARSDIWSLGVLLYEMLAGRRPFAGEQLTAVLISILNDPLPDLRQFQPGAPPALADLLQRMLVKHPGGRIASMRQVAAELEAIRSGRAPETLTPAVGIPAGATPAHHKLAQEIRFCLSADGARIAYATVGEGPPLVKTGNWLSHLEYDWESPVWRHWLMALTRSHTLVRYDKRGCGLSDWDVADFSLEAQVNDLEAVVDALGLERFPLLGLSGGGPIAVAYAVRHPERVSHLVLYGSYVRGRLARSQTPEQVEEAQMLLNVMKLGWGKENPAFRQVYTNLFIPDGTAEQIRWFNDLQRISTSPEVAVRMSQASTAIDVSHLAPDVRAPTLVLHARDDAVVPFEQSRQLAALIPGARFMPLDGRNHILLENEPGWQRFVSEVMQFVTTEEPAPRQRHFTPEGSRPATASGEPVSLSLPLATPAPLFTGDTHEEGPAGKLLFVGREPELARLDACLDAALAGNGRVVFVSGDAGRGKTALVQEFARRATARQPDLVVANGNCNAYTGAGDPYLPFREILELLTGEVEARWAAGAFDRQQAQRLWQLALPATEALVSVGPDLIGAFLPGQPLLARLQAAMTGVPTWWGQLQRLAAPPVDGEGRAGVAQGDLLEQYTRVLQSLARRRPLVLVLDDLQWADSGSLNLLFHLGRRLPGHRLLIVGIYRPTDVALGRDDGRHPLEPLVNEFQRLFGDSVIDLSQVEDRQFVQQLLDAEPNRLEASFVDALYRHTGGHALFTAEILRGLKERGELVRDEEGHWVEGDSLNWQILPARVEGVIEERIGRLPAGLRETLRLASVAGERFAAEVVARVQGVDERAMIRSLSSQLDRQHQLVQGQGSRLAGEQRLSYYRFRHILFQRYLYHSLDEAEQAYWHEAVATELEEVCGRDLAAVAVDLAWHFERARRHDKAVAYLQLAAEQALQRSAPGEAIQHLNRGIRLLAELPQNAAQAQQELVLLTMLGPALLQTRSWADPEIDRVYTRARLLSQQLDDPPLLGPVLYGMAVVQEYRGHYRRAQALLEERLRLPHVPGNTELRLESHELLACSVFHQGQFHSALEHAQEGLALYDPQRHHALLPLHGKNLEVNCEIWAAHTLFFIGYLDQGLARINRALQVAQDLDHAFSLMNAQVQAAVHYQFRREPDLTRAWAGRTIALATEKEAPARIVEGLILQGWARAAQGQPQGVISQMRQGLDDYVAMGAQVDYPYYLALLAEAHSQAGSTAAALDALAEALALVRDNRAFYYEAELYRLKGALLLQEDETANAGEAEACFQESLAIARRQQARLLELRAATSLTQLWQRHGRTASPHPLLRPIYDWFSEGLDTPDLQAARALLNNDQ